MTGKGKPPRWERAPDADEDEDEWYERDADERLALERRRHRDPEETDERREAERRQHPRRRDRHPK